MVGFESIGDHEATRRRLEQIPNGVRKRATIVKHEGLVFIPAEIGIAIPLHYCAVGEMGAVEFNP